MRQQTVGNKQVVSRQLRKLKDERSEEIKLP